MREVREEMKNHTATSALWRRFIIASGKKKHKLIFIMNYLLVLKFRLRLMNRWYTAVRLTEGRSSFRNIHRRTGNSRPLGTQAMQDGIVLAVLTVLNVKSQNINVPKLPNTNSHKRSQRQSICINQIEFYEGLSKISFFNYVLSFVLKLINSSWKNEPLRLLDDTSCTFFQRHPNEAWFDAAASEDSGRSSRTLPTARAAGSDMKIMSAMRM